MTRRSLTGYGRSGSRLPVFINGRPGRSRFFPFAWLEQEFTRARGFLEETVDDLEIGDGDDGCVLDGKPATAVAGGQDVAALADFARSVDRPVVGNAC